MTKTEICKVIYIDYICSNFIPLIESLMKAYDAGYAAAKAEIESRPAVECEVGMVDCERGGEA